MLGGVFLWVLGMSMVNRSSSVNSAASPEDLHKLFWAGAKLGRSWCACCLVRIWRILDGA